MLFYNVVVPLNETMRYLNDELRTLNSSTEIVFNFASWPKS